MADKIKYSITTSDGKTHEVSKENVDKYGIKAYAESYKGATIRMRDQDGADYDIPLVHYDKAAGKGLHAYSIAYSAAQPDGGAGRAMAQSLQENVTENGEAGHAVPQSPQASRGAVGDGSASGVTGGGWHPTVAQRIAARHKVQGMVQGLKDQNEAQTAQVERAAMHMTPEGRRELSRREQRLKAQGIDSRLMGVESPDAPFGMENVRRAAEDQDDNGMYRLRRDRGMETMRIGAGDATEGARWRQDPVVWDVTVDNDGHKRIVWMLPDGTLTDDAARARHAKGDAMYERRGDAISKEIDETLAAQATEDISRQNKAAFYNPTTMSGAMQLSDAQSNVLEGVGDPHQQALNVLASLPEGTRMELMDRMRRELRLQGYHGGDLESKAQGMALADIEARATDLAYKRATPQDNTEFYFRKVGLSTIPGMLSEPLSKTAAQRRIEAGAMADYESDHELLGLAGTVTGMAMDPTMYLFGGIGSAAGKIATNLAGKILYKGATSAAAQRAVLSTLGGRLMQGAAAAAGNFWAFEMGQDAARQVQMGGVQDEKTGNMEGYSLGHVLGQGVHGLWMGALMGGSLSLIGNVGDKLVKATRPVAGKAGIRAAQYVVSPLAEATIFSTPEWLSSDRDKSDVWKSNLAMVAGFKATHLVKSGIGGFKSAREVISQLRPVRAENGRELTRAERNHNRMSFAERVGRVLDKSSSDISLTREEREELREKGYGELADLLRKGSTGEKAQAEIEAEDGSANIEVEQISHNAELDGYDAMERLIDDGSVSQAARAKAYHILTGRMLPMSSVMGHRVIQLGDGKVRVESMASDGEVVTSRVFGNMSKARTEIDRITRQAELNTIDIGEQSRRAEATGAIFLAAMEEVAELYETVVDPIRGIYERYIKGETLSASEKRVAQRVDEAIERYRGVGADLMPESIRREVEKRTGVDIDKAIRKSEAHRSEEEQQAVMEYLRRLYPEDMSDGAVNSSENRDPGSQDGYQNPAVEAGQEVVDRRESEDPQEQAAAQAEIDDIGMQYRAAREQLHDVFGPEAEMRIAEIEEDPLGVMNDPELTMDQQDAVVDFLNAKMRLDGVQAASDKNADEKRVAVERAIEQRTHRGSGMIQPIVLKFDENGEAGDRPVFLVGGDIALLPDGKTVDSAKSSQALIYFDKESGQIGWTSPERVASVGAAVDPQTELANALAEVEAGRNVFPSEETEPDTASENIPVDGNNEGENIPEVNFKEYDRGYNDAIEEAQNLSDERLDYYVNVLREGSQKQMQEDGRVDDYIRGRLEALEFVQQDRAGVAVPKTEENVPNPTENAVSSQSEAAEQITDAENVSETVSTVENGQHTALQRIPLHPETGKPVFEAAEATDAWDALVEAAGGDRGDAQTVVLAQIRQAEGELTAAANKKPVLKQPKLSGDPIEMLAAQRKAKADYDAAMAEYERTVVEKQAAVDSWQRIRKVHVDREMERQRREAEAERAEKSRQQQELEQMKEQAELEQERMEAQLTAEAALPAEQEKALARNNFEDYMESERRAIMERNGSDARQRLSEKIRTASGARQYGAIYEALSEDSGQSATLEEYLARSLSMNKTRVLWSGHGNLNGELFGRRKGERVSERRQYGWMTSDKDGVPFARLVHELWEGVIGDDALPFSRDGITDQDVRNAVIDLLRSHPTSRSLFEYAVELHDYRAAGENARGELAELGHMADGIRDDWYREHYGLSREDYEARVDVVHEELRRSELSDDEVAELDAMVADDLARQDGTGIENEIDIKDSENGREQQQQPGGDAPTAGTGIGDMPEEQSDESQGAGGVALQGSEAYGGGGDRQGGGLAGAAESTQGADGADGGSAGLRADPEPTEAQKEAGNYKKKHVRVDGHQITIENERGSVRSGRDRDGKEWHTEMHNDYGYIRGTEGVDGDHIDVFLSDAPEQGDVFVVDQYNEDGSFDEHKVMYGFADAESARKAYLSNYEQGWEQTRRLDVTGVSKDEFKKWIGSSKRKTKPFSEYRSVTPIESNSVIGRSLTEQEATELLSRMEATAVEAPQIELTPENWIGKFGEDGKVSTPLGEVKLGENQFIKLFSRKRAEYFGMMYPTLNAPDVIIEKNAPSDGAERDTKLLFVKTFVKPDGGRIVHFESITVQRDGMEVSISSHEAEAKDIKKDMQKEKILHISERLSPSSEWSLTEAPQKAEGPDLVPTSDKISSDGEVNTLSSDKQENSAESSAAERTTPEAEKQERIEDFGEKIAGARKDALAELSRTMESVTEQSLVELPLGKVFKRPNLARMVKDGVITDDEAVMAEAVMSGLIYARKKPVLTRKLSSRRAVEQWAKETYHGVRLLAGIMSGDPARREAALKEYADGRQSKLEAAREHLENIRGWNRDKTFRDIESLPDPVEVIHRVLEAVGYRPGDKVELPLSSVEMDSTYQAYVVNSGTKSRNLWFERSYRTLDEAIDAMVTAARIARGDKDVELPARSFQVRGDGAVHKEHTGIYEAHWIDRRGGVNYREFATEAQAADFARQHQGVVREKMRSTGEYDSYSICVTNPLTGQRHVVRDGFASRSEAGEALESMRDQINALAMEAIGKEMGLKNKPREHFYIASSYNRRKGKGIYSVMEDDRRNPWPVVRDFDSRQEAEAWLKDNIQELEARRKERIKARNSVVYFKGAGERRGSDHRGGRDATPEMFGEAFGFRGVQFGNWTKDADRQEALNQAFDALSDLAQVLGMPTRALSLDGELGLAFGARGSGSALAHYEPVEVVINLTKTRGAGSLAHEWWHALDNYMSRKGGVAMGYASHGNGMEGISRGAAAAVRDMMGALEGSEYMRRSRELGEYWGRGTEVTARLFAEWVNSRLEAGGSVCPFLTTGVDPAVQEQFQRWNYHMYKMGESMVAEREGRDPAPMGFDEFRRDPRSLSGFPYPTADEVKELGQHMERLFGAMSGSRGEGHSVMEPGAEYGEGGRTDRAPLQGEYVAPTIRDGEGLFVYAGRVAESYRHKKSPQEARQDLTPSSLRPMDDGLDSPDALVEERRGRYGRLAKAEASTRSLFDVAEQEDGDPVKAATANESIDRFSEDYMRYLVESERLETQLEMLSPQSEAYSEARELLDQLEAETADAMRRLEDGLADYYNQGEQSPEDARRAARDMAGRVRAEIEIRRRQLELRRSPGEVTEGAGDRTVNPEDAFMAGSEGSENERSASPKVRLASGDIVACRTMGRLPKLEDGEFAMMERQFSVSGEFRFDGSQKLGSVDDVAYLFRELESYAVEHTFAVLTGKDGARPVIVHLGMGTQTASPVDLTAIRAAFEEFGAEGIYFVHNHPSGVLRPSQADVNILGRIRKMFDGQAKVEAVIMDATTGKYSVFTDGGVHTEMERPAVMAVDGGTQTAPVVLQFDRSVVFGDRRGMDMTQIRSSEDVARFMSAQRLSGKGKIGFLVLSNSNEIIGDFHTTHESLTQTEALGDEMVRAVTRFGGRGAIVYGNMPLDGAQRLSDYVAGRGYIRMLDAISVENGLRHSAMDNGLMREPSEPYGRGGSEVQEPALDKKEVERISDDESRYIRNPAERTVIADKEEFRKYLQDAGIEDTEIADVIRSLDEMRIDGKILSGGFDPMTGKIVIFAEACKDAEDAALTLQHEELHHHIFMDSSLERSVGILAPAMKRMDPQFWRRIQRDYRGRDAEMLDEEMVVNAIEHAIRTDRLRDIFQHLDDAEKQEFSKLINTIGYETEVDRSGEVDIHRRIYGTDASRGQVDTRGDRGSQGESSGTTASRSPGQTADGIRFRIGGVSGSEDLGDVIARMRSDAEAAIGAESQSKREAMRAIGGNLGKLRQAMSRQRKYDKETVKAFTDLAKSMLEARLLDDPSRYETSRLLGLATGVVGKEDIGTYIDKLFDIMIENQLRMGENAFGKLLAIKGSKVDGRGIEVQGKLDPEGVAVAKVVRKSTSLPKDVIDNLIADAIDRMSSNNTAIADEASIEYAGLQLARQYAENVTESKAEETVLRNSISQARGERQAQAKESAHEIEMLRQHAADGHISRGECEQRVHDIEEAERRDKDIFHQYVRATEDAIRQNRVERAEAYQSIVEQVGATLSESVERAKAWREADKQRVNDIHHNANSDMEGRPSNEHHKDSRLQKFANNSAVRFLLAPLGTFDQMLRLFGNKNARGEGYLWNRYMRGWVDATEKEYTGYRDALKRLDEKVSEVYGRKMKWGDLFSIDRKLPKATVRFMDGGEMKEHKLTQGNLLYIYMVDKMSDGRMKLRKMGITEAAVDQITQTLDPHFKQLADWMQDEFLVEKRNEYNEVHKRMFGTSMAAIDNYFPLKILANARIEEVDVADDTTDTALPSTSTGSIIKRRRNNLALDVTGANAFQIITDHLQQMERWSAFAEFNRDLNTLLSYKRFRNQVMNMTSVYGAGKTLWTNFRNVCSMAAGAYRPPVAALDKSAVNIAKGVTAAKVNLRVFTALKQLLSMPAYISDSNPMYLAKNIANPYVAWKWAMENLPIFDKRWNSRMSGDPRLMKTEMDWKMWRNRVVEIAQRVGMSPNAFVDALTVSIGAQSMYQTKYRKYKRWGMSDAEADRRAKQDATILFNQTQQSSESAFLSTMQVDRSWMTVLFTVFRNSSMSYTRQLYDAMRNLGHRLTPGYAGMSEEFMRKQMIRDGIDPDKATKEAKREYRRGVLRDLARVGVFGYVMQLAWNLGAYLPYLLLGDDDDEKEAMLKDVLNHTSFGSIEGLTGGDVMSAAGQMLLNGDKDWSNLTKDMPLAEDLATIYRKMGKDNVAALNDVVNLLAQSTFGVNPQTLTDAVVAVMDACGDDSNTQRECALLIARIMNAPQSQLDKVYFDELDADGEEASRMTPAEIAERYARYKMRRNAPLTGWMRNDEERDSVMTKQEKKVLKMAKEKIGKRITTADVHRLLDEHKATGLRRKELDKLWESGDEDGYFEGYDELNDSGKNAVYSRVGQYKRDINAMIKEYLRTKDKAQLDSIVHQMMAAREIMLEDVDSIRSEYQVQ